MASAGERPHRSTTVSPDESSRREFDLQLEEYRQLQAEGIERTRLQNTIIGSNFALVTAGVAVTKALTSEQARATLLLVLPLLSVVAALLYLDQTEHTVAKDEYVDTVLRPRFVELIGARPDSIVAITQRDWRRTVKSPGKEIFGILAIVRFGAVLAPGGLTLIGLSILWASSGSIRALLQWPHYALFGLDVVSFLAAGLLAKIMQSLHFTGGRFRGMARQEAAPSKMTEPPIRPSAH